MIGSVRSAGCDLYYEEAGHGLAILLIHPAGATASTWGAAAQEVARVGRVIAMEAAQGSEGAQPQSPAAARAHGQVVPEALSACLSLGRPTSQFLDAQIADRAGTGDVVDLRSKDLTARAKRGSRTADAGARGDSAIDTSQTRGRGSFAELAVGAEQRLGLRRRERRIC
jgi:hypothetical protein